MWVRNGDREAVPMETGGRGGEGRQFLAYFWVSTIRKCLHTGDLLEKKVKAAGSG